MTFLQSLLPSIPFAVLLVAFALGGYLLGSWESNAKQYHAGRVDGMREERSNANCRIMRAKLESYHAGVTEERGRKARAELSRGIQAGWHLAHQTERN